MQIELLDFKEQSKELTDKFRKELKDKTEQIESLRVMIENQRERSKAVHDQLIEQHCKIKQLKGDLEIKCLELERLKLDDAKVMRSATEEVKENLEVGQKTVRELLDFFENKQKKTADILVKSKWSN